MQYLLKRKVQINIAAVYMSLIPTDVRMTLARLSKKIYTQE